MTEDTIQQRAAKTILELRRNVDSLKEVTDDLADPTLKDEGFKEALRRVQESVKSLVNIQTKLVKEYQFIETFKGADGKAKIDEMLKDADLKLPESGVAGRDPDKTPGDDANFLANFTKKHNLQINP